MLLLDSPLSQTLTMREIWIKKQAMMFPRDPAYSSQSSLSPSKCFHKLEANLRLNSNLDSIYAWPLFVFHLIIFYHFKYGALEHL